MGKDFLKERQRYNHSLDLKSHYLQVNHWARHYTCYMYNNTDALILGEEGVIEGAFGTTGKFRLNMPGKDSFSLYCV